MTLDDIISKRIAPAMLERVVYDQGVVDETQRTALFKASGLPEAEIARRIVSAYGNRVARLAHGLYRQIAEIDLETGELLYEHFSSSQDLEANHQASLVARNPNLPMDKLSKFLESVKRQVCLIVSRKGNNGPVVCGTGFLVGPDLVLTCKHVLRSFVSQDVIGSNGDHIELYFDFFYGDPIDRLSPNLPEATKVGLDKTWYLTSGNDTDPDGLVGALSDNDVQRISSSLDFVLLRLDTRIGLQPVAREGGRRRGWVPPPPNNNVPKNLQPQDWIIIPQHPNGYSQRVDFGRFKEMDQTQTRIRYSTNTAEGTSGAPCFDQQFRLVGIHNAYVGKVKPPLANQAIRFDHIAGAVQTYMGGLPQVNDYALRWSASRRNEPPRVILDREKLLIWLRDSAVAKPRSLADRVYVAQASVPAAGCTFSIDVLEAEIRDGKTPRAVYGARGQQLPATPEDFLKSLLRELGIQSEQDDKMPVRPASWGSGTAGEIDKLDRWLSDELPNWLGSMIVKYAKKRTDIRDAAKLVLEAFKRKNQQAPQEIIDTAKAPQAIYVESDAWDCAYIVIDDLRENSYQGDAPRTELKGEVRSLIAALVQGKPEESLHPGLRRLRWMFLGYLPDFVAAADGSNDGATLEALNPAAIGEEQVAELVKRIWQALLPTEEVPGKVAEARAKTIMRLASRQAGQNVPLQILQQETNEHSIDILATIGS